MSDPQLLRLPMRDTPWPPGDNGVTECPICGAYWAPWAGSRLPCHGRCLLTKDGGLVCRRLWRGDTPFYAIAAELGVPPGVVRGTLWHRFGIRAAGMG